MTISLTITFAVILIFNLFSILHFVEMHDRQAGKTDERPNLSRFNPEIFQ